MDQHVSSGQVYRRWDTQSLCTPACSTSWRRCRKNLEDEQENLTTALVMETSAPSSKTVMEQLFVGLLKSQGSRRGDSYHSAPESQRGDRPKTAALVIISQLFGLYSKHFLLHLANVEHNRPLFLARAFQMTRQKYSFLRLDFSGVIWYLELEKSLEYILKLKKKIRAFLENIYR